MAHHVHTEPIPPSRRTELPIPAALDRLILGCLAKDPEHRPASAEMLGAELAECIDDTHWTPAMAGHWWDTHCPRAADHE